MERDAAEEAAARAGVDTEVGFREVVFSRVDLTLGPGTVEAVDALAPVLELLRADRAPAIL